MSQFAVFYYYSGGGGPGVLVKQGVMTHAEAEYDVEVRTFLSEYSGLLDGVAGNITHPFSFCLLYTSPSPRD